MARVKQAARPTTPENQGSEDLRNVDASPSELQPMKDKVEPSFYFGRSSVPQGLIETYVERRYFPKGVARAPVDETVPKPQDDDCVVFRDFFKAGFRVPCNYLVHCILDQFG